MSNIVSNSTPLIYLAKINKLGLLKIIYNEVFISEEVKKEVVDEGKRLKKLDANLVEKEINEGRIKVKKVSSLIEVPIELDKGEASTITLAKKLGIKEVLIDEDSARTAAKMLGLIPRGTLFILLKALKLNKIDFDEFLKVLDDLLKEGFRLREEVYLKVIKEAKRISQSS